DAVAPLLRTFLGRPSVDSSLRSELKDPMRALWLENRRLSLRDVPRPEPPAGVALVRVLNAGICNTDIELTHGYYPFTGIPGHEFVGEWDGKRVAGEINAACHS